MQSASSLSAETSRPARHRPFRLVVLQGTNRLSNGARTPSSEVQVSVQSAPAILTPTEPQNSGKPQIDCYTTSVAYADKLSRPASEVARFRLLSEQQYDRSSSHRNEIRDSEQFDLIEANGCDTTDATNPTQLFQLSQQQDQRTEKNSYTKRINSIEDQETTGDERESRSPEPIVEVKNSSSGSSASSSAPPSSGSEVSSFSDNEQDSASSRLIRKRTVKRQYHRNRAIREVEKEADVDEVNAKDSSRPVEIESRELVVHVENPARRDSNIDSINNSSKGYTANSVFRTRQIGSYPTVSNDTNKLEQQQQQSSSSKSKTSTLSSSTSTKHHTTSTSRCTSQSTITTNRKSTTSTQHRSSQRRQLEKKVESTSSSPATSEKRFSLHSKQHEQEESDNQMITRHSPSSSPTVAITQTSIPFEIEKASSIKNLEQIEQQESRVSRRESHISTSSRKTAPLGSIQSNPISRLHQEAKTNSSSSVSSSSTSKTLQSSGNTLRADMSSNSRHFNSSASSALHLSSRGSEMNQEILESKGSSRSIETLTSRSLKSIKSDAFQLFSSPDVRSLAQEIGSDFAVLENCVESASVASSSSSSILQHNRRAFPSSISSRLFGQRSKPVAFPQVRDTEDDARLEDIDDSSMMNEPDSGFDMARTVRVKTIEEVTDREPESVRSKKILELLNKAHSQLQSSDKVQPTIVNQLGSSNLETSKYLPDDTPISKLDTHSSSGSSPQKQRNSVMNESIERIEQRMSNLCKKLNECQDTKKAIELLEVMIQMVEKAWSVPVCGDDLGFRLCACLRTFGGIDFVLGLIHEAYDSKDYLLTFYDDAAELERKSSKRSQLRLDLSSSIVDEQSNQRQRQQQQETSDSRPPSESKIAKDSDSEILTSDLGLDSASIESLSCPTSQNNNIDSDLHETETETTATIKPTDRITADIAANQIQVKNGEPKSNDEDLQKEQLIFLSARLLSQSLTADNRNYLVESGWLEPVVKLACSFATVKCGQHRRKLLSALSRCMLTRQNSSVVKLEKRATSNDAKEVQSTDEAITKILGPDETRSHENDNNQDEDDKTSTRENPNDELNKPLNGVDAKINLDQNVEMIAVIGSEIIQNLFKHSEDICSTMISLGGLQAILYGCRSSNVEILRHCALALANLALHGGSDSQQLMIEHKAHVWLFPLAFNEDDNVQYYACLAIAILVANQEIESDVLKSSTLNLVEPFVTSHEPRKFAESTTAHIHGQSASWLRKLIPLLYSKREEARNLAAFHFAMEAYIKREQGQTKLFTDIGAIDPLSRLGSSPIAIASKFACQALRLIGEKQPHKLSQQVALWTCDDVLVWVSQVGFEHFRPQFLESGVDGDLLLQLDEQMLERDIGVQNGIIRRRFLRELNNLKRIADYSSLDKTGLCSILGSDNIQYAYPMLKFGVTRDNIHQLDGDQLLAECRVPNSIHRLLLAQNIKTLQDRMALEAAREAACEAGRENEKTLDVFVSYRRSTGSQLASLLKVHLQLRGFSVFIDVERLEAGKFDNNLLDSIKAAKNFILVLSPNALDRCIGDQDCKDWVHKETVAALASNCNIIPIMDNFHWPDAEQLPEDMRSIAYFNGIRWIHDYQDACVDKIERFIRGELSNNYAGSMIANSIGTNCSNPTNQNQPTANSLGGSLQRLTCANYASSTPSIGAPTPLSIHSARQFDPDYHPLAPYVMGASNQQANQNSGSFYLQHSGSLANTFTASKRVN